MALVEARSTVATARTAGVGESSIRRWLREDERFQTKLRQLREEALSHASLVRTAINFAFRSDAYSDLSERIAALEDNAPDRGHEQ